MPENNFEYTTTLGSTERVLVFDVEDENGSFALTGWTAVLNVTTSDGTAIITNRACVIDPDQVTNPGRLRCTIDFTVAAFPAMVVSPTNGFHKMRLKLTDPAGDISYYPGTRTVPYGKLYVLAA
jgi:hypothetical protein